MAEKHKYIVLEQLNKLALRAKADYVSRIGDLANLVAEAIQSGMIPGTTVTLSVENWNEKLQTVRNDIFLADGAYWYFVCGDSDCYTEYAEAGVFAKNVTAAGELQFSCMSVPKENLTVHILRLEVETFNE